MTPTLAALLVAAVIGMPGAAGIGPAPVGASVDLAQLDNSRREMARFCAREAARRYRVRDRWVETGRARARGNGFLVEGDVDLGRDGVARFACEFGPRGGFSSMREIARSGAPNGQTVLSARGMRRFCAKEAARRYQVNLGAVDIFDFEPVASGYVVTGRILRRQGRNPVFKCSFGPRGGFRAMAEVRG